MLLVGNWMSEKYYGKMYAKSQNIRGTLGASYDRALSQVDVLVMPTTPMKAHRYVPNLRPHGAVSHGWNMPNNTALFDMTSHPAITIPCAKCVGLPVGLMLVDRHFEDAPCSRLPRFRAARGLGDTVADGHSQAAPFPYPLYRPGVRRPWEGVR